MIVLHFVLFTPLFPLRSGKEFAILLQPSALGFMLPELVLLALPRYLGQTGRFRRAKLLQGISYHLRVYYAKETPKSGRFEPLEEQKQLGKFQIGEIVGYDGHEHVDDLRIFLLTLDTAEAYQIGKLYVEPGFDGRR